MSKIFVAFVLLISTPAFAEQVLVHCVKPAGQSVNHVVSGVFSGDNLIQMKAFYIFSNGQKPNPDFFFGKTSPGSTKNRASNSYFQGDGMGNNTTVYLPKNLTSKKGSTVEMIIVTEADGAGRSAEKLTCSVR